MHTVTKPISREAIESKINFDIGRDNVSNIIVIDVPGDSYIEVLIKLKPGVVPYEELDGWWELQEMLEEAGYRSAHVVSSKNIILEELR